LLGNVAVFFIALNSIAISDREGATNWAAAFLSGGAYASCRDFPRKMKRIYAVISADAEGSARRTSPGLALVQAFARRAGIRRDCSPRSGQPFDAALHRRSFDSRSSLSLAGGGCRARALEPLLAWAQMGALAERSISKTADGTAIARP